MKYLLTILIGLFSINSFAGLCEEYNDPSTELNLAIRNLIDSKDSSNARNLLAEGFSANTANACGATLLHIAAIMNNVDLARMLIDKGAHPNARNYAGQTPVFLAANWSSNEILMLLLENGGDPKTKVNDSSKYNTALLIAVVNGNTEGVRLLIESGANPEYRNSHGLSAKTIAAESNSQELIDALSQNQP